MTPSTSSKSIPRSRIIRKGSLAFALRGVIMLAKVCMLVLIVQRIGLTGFGVYTLLLYLPQQFNIFEAGLGAFVTREIAAKSAYAQDGDFDTLLSTGAAWMFFIGVVTAGLTWIVLFTFFDGLFLAKDGADAIAPLVGPAKHLAAISFLLVFGNMFCQRVLTGLHAFEAARIVNLVTILGQVVAIFLFVDPETGVAENINRLAAIWAGASLLSMAGSWVLWKRYMPCATRISIGSVRRSTARESAGFAWPLITAKILGIAMNKLDVWIVGAFLGPAAVGILDMAKRISLMATQLVMELTATVFPVASRLMSTEPDRIKAFMRDGTYYVFSISAVLCIGAAAVAPTAMIVFMGSEFSASVVLLWILLAGIVTNNLASCGTQVWLSMGLYKYTLIPFALGATIGLGLQFVLVGRLDELGAVLGVSIGMALRSVGLLVVEERTIPGGVLKPLTGLRRPLLFIVPAGTAAIASYYFFDTRTVTSFVVTGFVWSAICAAGLAVFVLQKNDRAFLVGKARELLGRV